MPRPLTILLVALLQGACTVARDSDGSEPLDALRRAAHDLRWTKGTEAIAHVDLTKLKFDAPVVVLALPPGTYRSGELDALIPSTQGREWLKDWRPGVEFYATTPTIYVVSPGRSMETYLHDDVSIPHAIVLWKDSAGDLEMSLERHGDEVWLVAVR